mgnify:FL=1
MIIKKYFTAVFICLGLLIGNMALATSSASAADAWVYEKNGIDTYVVTDSVKYNDGYRPKAEYAIVDIKHVHHNSGTLVYRRTFSFNHLIDAGINTISIWDEINKFSLGTIDDNPEGAAIYSWLKANE